MATEGAPTVTELLQRAHEAHADFSAAIEAVPQEILTAPGTIGTWSVRDVMAHVGASEMWMAGQMEALLAGELPTVQSCYGSDEPAPENLFHGGQDVRNAWQHERLRGLSLDEVRRMASGSHARLLAVIESFADEHLSEELTIVDLGTTGHVRKRNDGEEGSPLWHWLRGVTYLHYLDHANGTRALLNQRQETSDQRP